MSSKQHIILVSSGQPSLNPRLVKEADALSEAGYQVTVIYAYWNKWGTKMDAQLLTEKKWKAVRAGGDPIENPLTYFLSRILFKVAVIAYQKFNMTWFAEVAASRATFFLTGEVKRHKGDLYIGHNLGALPAVAKAARKFNKPFAFDAEDMHRYEVVDADHDPGVKLAVLIENKYLPKASYLSVSSPQIGCAYQEIFPDATPITILNVFPKSGKESISEKKPGAPLKLFWFSQTIGKGRGLNEIIETLLALKGCSFELNLLGELPDGSFKAYLDKAALKGLNVVIHPPVAPDDIPAFASGFDIGLATESGIPLNRDICLTNKIFTYLQAGLAILASDTTAQKDLLNSYPGIGKLYKRDNNESLSGILTGLYNDRQGIAQAKKEALALAHTNLNWETERVKFVNLVAQTLKGAG